MFDFLKQFKNFGQKSFCDVTLYHSIAVFHRHDITTSILHISHFYYAFHAVEYIFQMEFNCIERRV